MPGGPALSELVPSPRGQRDGAAPLSLSPPLPTFTSLQRPPTDAARGVPESPLQTRFETVAVTAEETGTPEIAALVARAQQRDFQAFEALVTLHRSKIYALALRMVHSASEAEELSQETFLSAWQNLPRFRGESAFGSWLHRICANFALMRLRRQKLEPRLADDPSLPEPRFDMNGSLLAAPSYDWARGTEEKALDRELRAAIEQASARLPDDYRTVFLLKDVEGLSYEEIAEDVGITVAAVKSRLHRARVALRESINAFYSPPARHPRPPGI